MKKARCISALLLVLALVVGSVTQGVQASDMALKMATATMDMPMPGGCNGCSGDDPGMLAACSAVCGIAAVLPLVPTVAGAISVAPPAARAISVAGLHGPPDPYPPKSSILS